MKKHIYTFAAFVMLSGFAVNAQTVADFESVIIPAAGYHNGSDFSKKFESGNIILKNSYDTAWGFPSWSGFAISNKIDTNTAGYFNQYSTIAGKGYNSSNNFALGYAFSTIILKNQAAGKEAKGFWITNNTYAYLSMKNGDSTFAKKFGGVSGNDTDWFKVTIQGYKAGNATKSKDFYLADFQNKDNSKDYIVKAWTWVDLTTVGNIDSLQFMFSSTDTGKYGMNTPGYFCMDNFVTSDNYTAVQNLTSNNSLYIYPCPASEIIYTSENLAGKTVSIFDMKGNKVYYNNHDAGNSIEVSLLTKGMYVLQILDGGNILQTKFVKQ
ncbi:MAG: DUF4465 domain-containing protein [Bacteroidota bacterium]|nr:DUF4465 domain-containing protein [Bacteroidota bacterium]